MENVAQVAKPSLIESIKEIMQPEFIAQKIGVDKNVLIDIGLYASIGFILGFLLKKYSEYFIACVLVCAGLVILQQFDYISLSINTAKIDELLGIPSMPGNDYGAFLLAWIKANVIASSSFAISFLLGLKIS